MDSTRHATDPRASRIGKGDPAAIGTGDVVGITPGMVITSNSVRMRWQQRGPADARTATALRLMVDDWIADTLEVSGERRADILVTVCEALANCADHAYRGRETPGSMILDVSLDVPTAVVVICVTDHGTWIEPVPGSPRGQRGRGIALMHAMADDVKIDGTADGTTVCLHFKHCRLKPEFAA